ncbi:MAG TPA: hemerythrin domain-containing protein [Verrucomicrobiae bacterium]|nr:hemerythrin domain-containing protein [Verrucomicrobiae bacterium]
MPQAQNQDQNRNTSEAGDNAIAMLKKDHRKVEALFSQCEETDDKRAKTRLVREICAELELHAKLEESLFYPAAKRQAEEAEDTVNEGIVEHTGIKRLVRELKDMTASEELFEAKFTVLQEYVKHHVKEEENEMFPKIEKSPMDLEELGARMAAAKTRLEAPATRTGRGRSRSNGRHASH